MKKLIFLLLLNIPVLAFAQKVPARMELAGVEVKLTKDLIEDIEKEVESLTVSPTYFQRKVDRVNIYFPLIERILQEEGVPEDVKFLVIQESALIGDAVSVSDAVGYWQFKDFTALEMGLQVDKNVDERMHIEKSTRAAARYLKKNNSIFDNWLYSIQAYQMGPGGAMKELPDKYYGVDFMELDKDTYWYLKKFIAHKIAFGEAVGDPGEYTLELYYEGQNKDLRRIAEETRVDFVTLMEYNKWVRRNSIPSDRAYSVILPLKNGQTIATEPIAEVLEYKRNSPVPEEIVNANFPVISAKTVKFKDNTVQKINGRPAIIASNEINIIGLAEKGGIPVSKFIKFNDIDVDHRPIPGQVYYFKRKKGKTQAYFHVLQEDETLWEISQRYGIRLPRLLHKNRLRATDEVKPGLVLWLRYSRPASMEAEYRELEKPDTVVERKEVYTNHLKRSVREKSNTNVDNNETKPQLDEQDILQAEIQPEEPSREIKHTVDLEPEKEEKVENWIQHQVTEGQTLYSISKLYNVRVIELLEWNELKITDRLAIGQELNVKITESIPGITETNEVSSEEVLSEKEIEEENATPADTTQENDVQEQITEDGRFHVVKAGESLYQIARKYELSVQELMELNGKTSYQLKIGERLIIKR